MIPERYACLHFSNRISQITKRLRRGAAGYNDMLHGRPILQILQHRLHIQPAVFQWICQLIQHDQIQLRITQHILNDRPAAPRRFGIPQVGVVTNDGEYLENNQLEPDIKVPNEPGVVSQGKDQQLEAAVQELLKQLEQARP